MEHVKITPLPLPGLLLIEPKRIGDHRGFFSETFRLDLFQEAAGPITFVQDNHSLTVETGTIRGLHYQAPPRAQGKLVRVVQGAIFDVAVDIRTGSATYGQHYSLTLSAENWLQLYIPPGFLHGFCTLTENCEVHYKTTDFYSAEHDRAIRFDDPELDVPWPPCARPESLSQKDHNAPQLSKNASPFRR